MRNLLNTPRRRTLAGALLAMGFVPVLLGITACLKTPVGDPEQGWVDPRISGIWLTGDPPADHAAEVWVIEPYDSRTWLMTKVKFEDSSKVATAAAPSPGTAPDAAPANPAQEEAAPAQTPDVLHILATLQDDRAKASNVGLYKTWLLSLSGRRFLVFEPKAAPSSDRGFRPELWIVLRVELAGDRMTLSPLDVDRDELDEVTSRGEAEAIIARHARDPDFYEEPLTVLYRIPRSAYDTAARAIERGITH